ncbi:MAG: hypothetical protein AB2745_14290 [Candidatus Thiodiazotropha endolucinida]|nr:hypothetical protein [Candidatus Thiodiazotropha taylori]
MATDTGNKIMTATTGINFMSNINADSFGKKTYCADLRLNGSGKTKNIGTLACRQAFQQKKRIHIAFIDGFLKKP